MTRYVVLGSDGQKHVFDLDPGLTPDQVEQQTAKLMANGNAPDTNATRSTVAPQPGPTGFAQSPAGRMIHGAVWDFGGPVVEGDARLRRMLGTGSDAWVSSVQQARSDAEQQYGMGRAAAGQSDKTDVSRTLGAAIPQVLLTRRLAGALPEDAANTILQPKTYMQTAKSGAAQGAVSGAVSNVNVPDDTSDSQYFAHAGEQALGAAASGLALAPAARFITSKALAVANPAYRWLKNWIAPKLGGATVPAQNISSDPAQLQQWMQQQATAAGVDWSKLAPDLQSQLMGEARSAMVQTGETPDTALANRFLAIRQGLPQLTTGQATRDPGQFSREANNPSDAIRSRFNEQQTAAAAKATQIATQAPGYSNTPAEMGNAVRLDVQAQHKAFDDTVQGLYDKAKSSTAGYQTITNAGDMAGNAMSELKRNLAWQSLDPDVKGLLQGLNGGDENLTVRRAVETLQALNRKISNAPKDPGLNIVKKHLDALVYGSQDASQVVGANPLESPTVGAQFLPGQEGDEAQSLFNQARDARRQMGTWQRSSSINGNLTDDRIAQTIGNEQIFQKYILGGTADNLANAWKTMSPDAQDEVRRRFVQHIMGMAGQRGADVLSTNPQEGVTQLAGYKTALDFLNKFPEEKLHMLLPGDSLEDVRNLLKYVRLTKEAPPGDFVNRSGTAPAIADWLSRTHYVPFVGQYIGPLGNMAGAAVRAADRVGSNAEALQPRLAPPGATVPGLDDAATPLTQRLAPAVVVPGVDSIAGAPSTDQEQQAPQ